MKIEQLPTGMWELRTATEVRLFPTKMEAELWAFFITPHQSFALH